MQTARIWHCELVPLHRVFSGCSEKFFPTLFLIFARVPSLSKGKKTNLRICWICICYCLPRVTYFFFVTRGSAQLLAVYIYLYCLKKKKKETGGHFVSPVILSFYLIFLSLSAGVTELIGIAKLWNIQLVSFLISKPDGDHSLHHLSQAAINNVPCLVMNPDLAILELQPFRCAAPIVFQIGPDFCQN